MSADPAGRERELAEVAERLRRRAVALRYDRERESAPRVIGKGRGYMAERIIELAQAEGITVYEDPDLVTMLSALDVSAQIPPKLYQVVAEVLAFVYRMNKMRSPGFGGSSTASR